jgi:hypothetical protein
VEIRPFSMEIVRSIKMAVVDLSVNSQERPMEMINVLNSSEIPDSHESCENCAYAKQRAFHE